MTTVDMDTVVAETVQELGATNAMLRLQLNAQIATTEALRGRLAELEQPTIEAEGTDPA